MRICRAFLPVLASVVLGACGGGTTTPPLADTTPPTLASGSPAGTLPAGTTATTLSVTTSENATCRYSTTAGTAYAAMTSTFATTGGAAHSTTLSGLASGQTYNHYLRCQDTAGNATTADYPVTFSVAGATGDTTAPSTPANLSATAISSGQINLSWTASTDNVGVTGYRVFRGGTQIASVTSGTTYQNTGLSPSTAYTYTVSTYDAAGNTSAQSTSASATTQSGTISSASAASRVFFDDFESGTINQWRTTGTELPPQVISTGCHSGTQCVSMNWDGTVAWNDPRVFTTMYSSNYPYNTEVFTRFWLKFDPDMDIVAANLGGGPKIVKWGPYTTNEIYLSPANGQGYALKEITNTSNIDLAFYGSPQSQIGTGVWHKVEQYMKTGNPGTITLWVDGVQVKTWSGNTAVGGSWFPFWFGSNWSGAAGCCDHDANNHMYVDDVEIYTDSTTGTPATGSLSDASIQAK